MQVCPKCASNVTFSGTVRCLCNKDFCGGQRCGASDLYRKFKCVNPDCGEEGTPDETQIYFNVYRDK